MQSELLQTMTARYMPREDRIALDCVIHDGRELRLMFTHRFARAVVAEFARQLSDGGRGALAQDFAQFEAVSGKPDAQPVESLTAEGAWLVTHLHIQSIENVQRLIFTEDDSRGSTSTARTPSSGTYWIFFTRPSRSGSGTSPYFQLGFRAT